MQLLTLPRLGSFLWFPKAGVGSTRPSQLEMIKTPKPRTQMVWNVIELSSKVEKNHNGYQIHCDHYGMTSYIKLAKWILLSLVWSTQQKIYPQTTKMMDFELQNCV